MRRIVGVAALIFLSGLLSDVARAACTVDPMRVAGGNYSEQRISSTETVVALDEKTIRIERIDDFNYRVTDLSTGEQSTRTYTRYTKAEAAIATARYKLRRTQPRQDSDPSARCVEIGSAYIDVPGYGAWLWNAEMDNPFFWSDVVFAGFNAVSVIPLPLVSECLQRRSQCLDRAQAARSTLGDVSCNAVGVQVAILTSGMNPVVGVVAGAAASYACNQGVEWVVSREVARCEDDFRRCLRIGSVSPSRREGYDVAYTAVA